MEQSNISRDHIALEAMKIIMDKTMRTASTPLQRLRRWLGIDAKQNILSYFNASLVARKAYQFADAMLAERDKDKEE